MQPANTWANIPEKCSERAFLADDMSEHMRPKQNYSTVSSPVKFHNSDDGPKGPAPKLGQDNFEVLKGIGINEEEINNLIDDGIVGNPQ